MSFLRWSLLAATVVVGLGFVALAVLGGGFRRSFGASDTHPLVVLLPSLALVLFLTSLLFPGQRPLLHTVAVLDLGLAAASLWLLRETAFGGCLGLGYAGLWFAYYWLAAWSSHPHPT
jgi:hypothetical protein